MDYSGLRKVNVRYVEDQNNDHYISNSDNEYA